MNSDKPTPVDALRDYVNFACQQTSAFTPVWVASLYASGIAEHLGYSSSEQLLDTIGVSRPAQQEGLAMFVTGILSIPGAAKRLGVEMVKKLRNFLEMKPGTQTITDFHVCKKLIRDSVAKIPVTVDAGDGYDAVQALKKWVKSDCSS
jgi:hypothetical protein